MLLRRGNTHGGSSPSASAKLGELMDVIIGFILGAAAVRLGGPVFRWLVKKEAKLIQEIERDANKDD